MPLQQASHQRQRPPEALKEESVLQKLPHINTIMVVSQVVIHNPKHEHNNISQLRSAHTL